MKMDVDYIKSVAQTIRQQLFALTPVNVLMSWGISKMMATSHNEMPSLMLVVNGRLYKGSVLICLNECSDYYEIYFRDKEDIRKVAQDLDFTQIGTELDRLVEKGDDEDEYNAFCEQERIKLMNGQI